MLKRSAPLGLVIITGLLATPAWSKSDDDAIRVYSEEEQAGDATAYRYSISNETDNSVVEEVILSRDLLNLPDTSPLDVKAPPGWSSKVIRGQEGEGVEIQWSADQASEIQPGESVEGFDVNVGGSELSAGPGGVGTYVDKDGELFEVVEEPMGDAYHLTPMIAPPIY